MVYCIFYGSKRWKSRSFSSTFNAPCWFFADQSTVERMNEELKLYVYHYVAIELRTLGHF